MMEPWEQNDPLPFDSLHNPCIYVATIYSLEHMDSCSYYSPETEYHRGAAL